VVLCSFVGAEVAHVMQLAVAPHSQGSGLGYELLRRAAGVLRARGAREISLTVTVANAPALRLYERCGFAELRRFFALVWEQPL